MKRIHLLPILTLALLLSCDKMDDNYSHYLEEVRIYPPKVTNLEAVEGLREVFLTWDNPSGDLATKILINYGDDSILFETMVDSAHIENLEIKGYDLSVYTLDAFDNRSVPTSLTIFPNGEN